MKLVPGRVICACSWHGEVTAKAPCPSCGRPAVDRIDAARIVVLLRVLADPEFIAAYRSALELRFRAAMDRAQVVAVKAVDRLATEVDSATKPGDRINAADRLLHHVVKLRDSVDLARRVEELEARLNAAGKGGETGEAGSGLGESQSGDSSPPSPPAG